MTYTTEFELINFPAWGGATAVIDKAREVGRFDELEDLVNEYFEGSFPTITEVNDFIWFYANDALDLWNENEDEEDENN